MNIKGIVTKSISQDYQMFSPKGLSDTLLVYLHPAGDGSFGAFEYYRNLPKQIRKNIFVLCPIAPRGDTFSVESLYFLISEIIKTHNIKRVVAVGYSMGGRNLLDLCYEYPLLFDSIVVISGYTSYLRASKLKNLRAWFFHSVDDGVVPVIESKKMVGAMKEQGNENVRLSLFENTDHGLGFMLLGKKPLYDWLLGF